MGTPYEDRPVGNSPEMMPLDASLNKDHDDGVRLHMSVTSHLNDDDPKKFSLSTPKRGSSAYLRVWEGIPSSHRIIEDTNKFLTAIHVIAVNKGIVVAGLGTRKGHRSEGARNLKKRGGRRVKQENSFKQWIHDDAKSVMDVCIDLSINKHGQHENEGSDVVAVAASSEIMVDSGITSTEEIMSTRPCEDWRTIVEM